jgi:hypothetical protein
MQQILLQRYIEKGRWEFPASRRQEPIMITLEKLRIYKRFAGDDDAWARTLKHGVAPQMTDQDRVKSINFFKSLR